MYDANRSSKMTIHGLGNMEFIGYPATGMRGKWHDGRKAQLEYAQEKMREEVESASTTAFSSDFGIMRIRNEAVAGRQYEVRRRCLFVKDGRYYSTFVYSSE